MLCVVRTWQMKRQNSFNKTFETRWKMNKKLHELDTFVSCWTHISHQYHNFSQFLISTGFLRTWFIWSMLELWYYRIWMRFSFNLHEIEWIHFNIPIKWLGNKHLLKLFIFHLSEPLHSDQFKFIWRREKINEELFITKIWF